MNPFEEEWYSDLPHSFGEGNINRISIILKLLLRV